MEATTLFLCKRSDACYHGDRDGEEMRKRRMEERKIEEEERRDKEEMRRDGMRRVDGHNGNNNIKQH